MKGVIAAMSSASRLMTAPGGWVSLSPSVLEDQFDDRRDDIRLEHRQLQAQYALANGDADIGIDIGIRIEPMEFAGVMQELRIFDLTPQPFDMNVAERPGLDMQIEPIALLGEAAAARSLVSRGAGAVDR